MAVFPREIEQRRQHLRRQFDRDPLNPVKLLVARQVVEDGDDALADQRLQLIKSLAADARHDRFAPFGMEGVILADETAGLKVGGPVPHENAVRG